MGDLNYRIEATKESIFKLFDDDLYEVLLSNCQLFIEKEKTNAFYGFKEGLI